MKARLRKKDETLEAGSAQLAAQVVELQYQRSPDLASRFGPQGRQRCLVDTTFHIDFLEQAVSAADSRIFLDYVAWAKALLVYRGFPLQDFQVNLECLLEVVSNALSLKSRRLAAGYVEDALRLLPSMPTELPSFIDESQPQAALANDYLKLLLVQDRGKAGEVIKHALKDGVSIPHIYQHIFTPALHEVGRLWQQNKITVAQEHYCTAATEIIMAQVFAQVLGRPRRELRLLAFCAEGEHHCVGIRMFSELMELNGWAVVYLGGDVPVAGVLAMAEKKRPHVVAISATMAFRLQKIESLIKALRASSWQPGMKFLVGGRAFEQDRGAWQRFGADAFAPDLIHGLETAESLIVTGVRGQV